MSSDTQVVPTRFSLMRYWSQLRDVWQFCILLLVSLLLLSTVSVIQETLFWTDPHAGFWNGIYHLPLSCIAGVFFVTPWAALIFMLYRWRKWRRFRAMWVLSLSVLLSIHSLYFTLTNPLTPESRFQRMTKCEFPQNAQNVQTYFSGGGLADYSDYYYFDTTPEEVQRLIRELELTGSNPLREADIPLLQRAHLQGFPDFSQWVGAKRYHRFIDLIGFYYEVIVHPDQTKVYMNIGST